MTISVSPNEEKTEIFGIPIDALPTYARKPQIGNKPTEVHEGINYELLDEILSYIKAHPDTWRQESWFKIVDKETGRTRYESEEVIVSEVNSCGAAFCFAGHVALHEGFPSPPLDNNQSWFRVIEPTEDRPDKVREEASEFATKRLGLTISQADALFNAENSLENLEDIIEALRLAPEISGWELDDVSTRRFVDEEDWSSDERISVRQYLIEEGILEPDLIAA